MVGAVMAVRQARGGGAGSTADDLVAEADPEHGNPPERLARKVYRPFEHRGVAGPVGQHEPVYARGGHIRPGRGVRKYDHATSALAQRAKDVQLHAVVDDSDREAGPIRFVARAELGWRRIEPFLP